MNNHLKHILKGVLILFWMIVYWILIGLVPKGFQNFYEQFHDELLHFSIAISILIFLFFVSFYYRKSEKKSITFISLLAGPYLLFLITLLIVATNLPRITDLFLLIIGVVVIFIVEKKRHTKKQKMSLIIMTSILIIPTYYLIYDNILNYVNKSELVENQTLGDFNFKITNREGASFSMNEFKDKTVCVDMWSSSCGNCISSMPDFEKLNLSFKSNKDYKIISLFCPIKKEQTYEWFKEYIDRKFDYDIEYYYIDFESFNKLNIRQFPEFLIINKKSNLVYRGQISYLPYVSDNIYNKLKSINEDY